ncbi:hypothetical protein [Nostoc sp.]
MVDEESGKTFSPNAVKSAPISEKKNRTTRISCGAKTTYQVEYNGKNNPNNRR